MVCLLTPANALPHTVARQEGCTLGPISCHDCLWHHPLKCAGKGIDSDLPHAVLKLWSEQEWEELQFMVSDRLLNVFR